MRECLACGSVVDPDSTSEFCSVEPESWGDSRIVRLDALRRRAGLASSWIAAAGARHEVAPATRQAFFAALLARSDLAPRRVVREDLAKVWGHSLATAPDARVHWQARDLTVCGRPAGSVLHTQDRTAVTCRLCTFDLQGGGRSPA